MRKVMRFGIVKPPHRDNSRALVVAGEDEGGGGGGENNTGVLMLPYWRPTLHLQLVPDSTLLPARGLPPNIGPTIMVAEDEAWGKAGGSGGRFGYLPHLCESCGCDGGCRARAAALYTPSPFPPQT